MKHFIVLILLSGVFQFSNGNPTGDIKILGGEDAVLGQFPHQVLWVELVSKELNHLAAILHVYARGLNFMKLKNILLSFFKKKMEILLHF